LEHMPIDQGDWVKADPLMLEYENEVTPPWRDFDQRKMKTSIEHQRVLHQLKYDETGQSRPLDDPAAIERFHAALRSIESVLRDQVKLEMEIARINRVWFQRLADTLSVKSKVEFKRQFLIAAYPAVFPDPADPEKLLDIVSNDVRMNEQLKAGLAAVDSAFRTQYDSICLKMMEGEDEWWGRFAATSTSEGMEEHQTRMSQWRRDRWQAVRNLLSQVESMVPPEVLNDILKEVRRIKNTMEFLENQEATLEEMRQGR
jgi:ubiquinone biosynthesis protein UbiJ